MQAPGVPGLAYFRARPRALRNSETTISASIPNHMLVRLDASM